MIVLFSSFLVNSYTAKGFAVKMRGKKSRALHPRDRGEEDSSIEAGADGSLSRRKVCGARQNINFKTEWSRLPDNFGLCLSIGTKFVEIGETLLLKRTAKGAEDFQY